MKMSRLISFIIGVYGGVYICQNYQIPHLPGPIGLWEKIQNYSKDQDKKGKD